MASPSCTVSFYFLYDYETHCLNYSSSSSYNFSDALHMRSIMHCCWRGVRGCLIRNTNFHGCVDTRGVTMHRDTWAGDTCIVSRPKYRDTKKKKKNQSYMAFTSVLPFLLLTHSVDCAVHLLLCHSRALLVNSALFLKFTALKFPIQIAPCLLKTWAEHWIRIAISQTVHYHTSPLTTCIAIQGPM